MQLDKMELNGPHESIVSAALVPRVGVEDPLGRILPGRALAVQLQSFLGSVQQVRPKRVIPQVREPHLCYQQKPMVTAESAFHRHSVN